MTHYDRVFLNDCGSEISTIILLVETGRNHRKESQVPDWCSKCDSRAPLDWLRRRSLLHDQRPATSVAIERGLEKFEARLVL
jgi:hypothetical protein